MAILVTGGAGYIGSHTCVELLNAGEKIIIVDNFSNSKPEVIDAIQTLTGKEFVFYHTDILDKTALHAIFSEHEIESVIHFAGFKAVGESVEKPLEYYENNIAGTLVLCKMMREFGCKKIVFSSSATVYGANNSIPFREEYPTSATNPYGQTKLMVEQILTDLQHADPTMSVALLRYFNPIGAHPSGLIGEDPNDIPNNLVPYIAKVACGELPHLNIFGNDYDTPDGTGVRDYIHVVDLAKGHLKALQYLRDHHGVEAINLGTGIGYSVLDILAAYEQACGKSLPFEMVERRPGDIAMYYADPSKAKKLLDWEATLSLEDMCNSSWNFIQTTRNMK